MAFLWYWRCCWWRKLSMIYRYASQCSKMILMMLSSHLLDVVDDVVLSLSHMMPLKNTLLVKGECWNNVTAKSSIVIINILFIGTIPIVIDHVSYCNRTKSHFVDWSKENCNRKNKKSAPADIKEAQKYNKGGFTHPAWDVGPASEETLHTCQTKGG